MKQHHPHHHHPPPPHHHRPHHPPHHHEGSNGHPPPPPHLGHWQPPLPTERDLALLEQLLGNPDEARSVFRLLQSCPPEVAAIGCLVLRVYERIEPPASEASHAAD
jgi:hypothetical protein